MDHTDAKCMTNHPDIDAATDKRLQLNQLLNQHVCLDKLHRSLQEEILEEQKMTVQLQTQLGLRELIRNNDIHTCTNNRS